MPQPGSQTICPETSAAELDGLLALCTARQLTLAPNTSFSDELPEGRLELIAALQGDVSLTADGGTGIPAGTLALLATPCSWSLHTARSEAQCAVVRLAGDLPTRLLCPEQPCTLYPGGAAAIRETVSALSVIERESGAVDAYTASAQAYTLLMKLLRLRASGGPGKYSILIEAAIGIIDEEFAYLEGLDTLADRLEVSKPHLIRTFTREVGISPGKYITRARIEYAKLLLSEPDMSIAFAAEAAGFAGANYFAKVFRRETGLSPSEFQQAAPPPRRKPRALRDEDRLYMP